MRTKAVRSSTAANVVINTLSTIEEEEEEEKNRRPTKSMEDEAAWVLPKRSSCQIRSGTIDQTLVVGEDYRCSMRAVHFQGIPIARLFDCMSMLTVVMKPL